jgi:hypothetical protein
VQQDSQGVNLFFNLLDLYAQMLLVEDWWHWPMGLFSVQHIDTNIFDTILVDSFENLSCVATSVFRMRLLHVVAFSKKLRWLAQTKVITLKTQLYAVNAFWSLKLQIKASNEASTSIFN